MYIIYYNYLCVLINVMEIRLCHMCNLNLNLYIVCTICKCAYHAKCIGISKNTFCNMAQDAKDTWLCIECQLHFPYNNLSDDGEFIQHCQNVSLQQYLYNDDVYFTICEYQDNKCYLPMCDEDPDTNHFNNIMSDVNKLSSSIYYELDDFKSEITNYKNVHYVSSVLHLNIRSMNKNVHKLTNMLDILSFDFDIIAISETWLN